MRNVCFAVAALLSLLLAGCAQTRPEIVIGVTVHSPEHYEGAPPTEAHVELRLAQKSD